MNRDFNNFFFPILEFKNIEIQCNTFQKWLRIASYLLRNAYVYVDFLYVKIIKNCKNYSEESSVLGA